MTVTAFLILGTIMNTANGHWITLVFIAGTADLPGRGSRILSGRMGMPEPQSEGTVCGCDTGDLWAPPLLG